LRAEPCGNSGRMLGPGEPPAITSCANYIVRERIVLERIIGFERIIFFEDMRFDFIILLERIGAIMPG
jgi:hypothetical protein